MNFIILNKEEIKETFPHYYNKKIFNKFCLVCKNKCIRFLVVNDKYRPCTLVCSDKCFNFWVFQKGMDLRESDDERDYFGETVDGEEIDFLYSNIATLAYTPIVPGSLEITVSKDHYVPCKIDFKGLGECYLSYNPVHRVSFKVNHGTGKVIASDSYGALDKLYFSATYEYDSLMSGLIPPADWYDLHGED